MGWIIPAIMGVTGVVGSILQNKAKNKSQQEQVNLYNDWLKQRQSGVNDLVAALQAGGINIFGPQTTSTMGGGTSASQTASQTAMTSQTTPVITPEYQAMEATLRKIIEDRLKSPTALPGGYAQAGIRNINEAYADTEQQLRNLAARRGISGDTFVMNAPSERARRGQIADFQTQLPLQERAMRDEDLSRASSAISQFGLGSLTNALTNALSSTTGQTSSWGQSTAPPNIGALANLFLPEAPFQSTNTGQSTGGDLMTGLAQLFFTNPDFWTGLFNQGGGGNAQPNPYGG